ncbi:MAG: T9SS type A sorting domain-containing protein [Bacteroidia bacterium]|nr:T9SS type A sorting domain-containing protein [Bacteroidia bacterium]
MKIFTNFKLFMLLLLLSASTQAQNYNVTFKVDMSQYVGLNDTVYVNGTWNSWCGRCNPLVKQGTTNVWEGTFSIPAGNHEFKYTIGGWTAQESLANGLPCTITNGGFTNRAINLTAATTLPTVCWNSCAVCSSLLPMNLPVRFDSSNVNNAMIDFGGTASEVANDPVVSTNKVGKVTKSNTAETWAGTTLGSTIGFPTAIPFTPNTNKMIMRVYSPDSGIVVRLKAEDATVTTISVETDARTTVANAWQTLEFNFANQGAGTAPINYGNTYKKISVFFNYNVAGSAAGTKVYYFDDLAMAAPSGPVLAQVRVPIYFDSANVNYAMTDFGGTTSSVVADPINSNNKVGKVIKSNTAETWAGTTLSTNAGLAQAIPFAPGSTKMTMRVFAPDSGIVVRLKAEQVGDNTKSVETDARTTVANAWQTLEFNFANQGTGTAAINYTYTYNMLSAFFNYNVAGSVTGEKTYYFDDVVFGGGITPPPPTKVDVTFNVDVKNVPMAPGDTVTLNGTFNGWCGACNKMTNLTGTSVWTTTIALDTTKEYEFKYTIGNWASQENLASTLTCTKTTSGFTNRVITTGKANQNLPTVCWETCGPCASGGPTKTNLTFQVDMSKYALAPSDTVTLNGNFNNWCGKCTPMTKKVGTDIWTATVLLDKDSTYDFKYTIGNWAAQEILKEGSSCTTTKSGFTNRTITVNKVNDTLPVVCWESCVSCANSAPKTKITFRVNMKNYVGDLSKGVTLNGSFNGWCGNCTPMTLIGNNIYSVTLTLDSGSYTFKYTIGNWDDEESFAPGDPCTKTDGNFTNRFVNIADTNAIMVGAYCWNTCTICNAVGLEEVLLNNATLFPNPANETLHIDFGQSVKGKTQVGIYNLIGAKVSEKSFSNANNGMLSLDIQSLEAGIYLVKIEMNEVVKTYKIVVE